MFCSLSGSPLVDPVICKKTGYLYEKSTITKQIAAKGICPHTQQPLTQDDLISISHNKQSTVPTLIHSTDNSKIIPKL